MTDDRFPNREHRADHVATQARAIRHIADIRRAVTVLEREILKATNPDKVSVTSADVAGLEDEVRRLGACLERLGTLSNVRQWHKADQAEAEQHMVRLVTGETEDGIDETQVFMFNRVTDGETYVGAVRDEEDYLTWKPADITMERKEGA